MEHGLNTQDPQIVHLIARLRLVFSDERLYRRLVRCQTSDAQRLLDCFQRLLDTPGLDPSFRSSLIVATQRISTSSGLYPACYELKGVVQDSQHPVNAGGFADIYKGNFQGQVVCLKTLRFYQNTRIEDVLKGISKETILWSQLSHPNVLAVYGIFRFQTRLCIVSPWMAHGDVKTYLKNNPTTPRLPLAFNVASGLLYLHDNGIIHGDLKGPNILIDDSGQARLADFGISGVSDSNIIAWTSQPSGSSKGGSVRWQAPELFNVQNGAGVKNSAASDIYAWGCVVYEIFTGEVPFPHIPRDAAVILYVISGGRPTRPRTWIWNTSGLTLDIWLLMQACWEARPDQRPSSAMIVDKLSSMLPDRPIPPAKNLSSANFRRQMGVPVEILTVEAFNRIMDKTVDLEYLAQDDESLLEDVRLSQAGIIALPPMIEPLLHSERSDTTPSRSRSSSLRTSTTYGGSPVNSPRSYSTSIRVPSPPPQPPSKMTIQTRHGERSDITLSRSRSPPRRNTDGGSPASSQRSRSPSIIVSPPRPQAPPPPLINIAVKKDSYRSVPSKARYRSRQSSGYPPSSVPQQKSIFRTINGWLIKLKTTFLQHNSTSSRVRRKSSTIRGWFNKWRGTFGGNEAMRSRGMREMREAAAAKKYRQRRRATAKNVAITRRSTSHRPPSRPRPTNYSGRATQRATRHEYTRRSGRR